MRGAALPAGRAILPALALGLACTAQAGPADPMAWLQRASQAARNASYAGTYVHTNGDRTATVRITHVVAGGEEHERVEPLDGANLEIVRRNDEMLCYFRDAKTVRLDPRVTSKFFPAVVAAPAEVVAASYDVKLESTDRVLGYQCQWIRLQPRDALRYAQRLCSEVGTGLVLRAKTINEQKQVIEQYTFTDLKLGPQVAGTELKSLFRARTRQWISDGQPRDGAASTESGWQVKPAPPGFQKVAELSRQFPGREQPVTQMIFSDGVASFSVFIEPGNARNRAETSSEDGTTTYYSRPLAGHLATVLGEVPMATVQQVARSVARHP